MSPWPVALRLVELARTAGLVAEPDDESVAGTAPEHRFDAERTVAALGDHLGRLHRLAPPGTVPAAEASGLLDAARRRTAGGLGAEDLPAAYRHIEPARLADLLADGLDEVVERSATDPPVVVHGRPLLATLRFRLGQPVGLSDWERVEVADRHLDLAVAALDVVEVFGPVMVPVLFDAYGDPPPDPRRIDWYALADALLGRS